MRKIPISFFRKHKINFDKNYIGLYIPKIQAVDIDDVYGHATNAEMYEYIVENLDYDQIIWEFGDDDNPDWVHVSYVSPEKNRKRQLRAERKNGKTTYKLI